MDLIKLCVGSGNICRAFTSFQRGEYALEYKVWDMEVSGVMRATGRWCMKDWGRRGIGGESVEELLVRGERSGWIGHDERSGEKMTE